MRRVSRFQVAAGVTALFVGGTIAAGIALRPDASMNAGATASPKVIHQRKVKTISVPAGPPSATTPGVGSAAQTATPVSVTSRTSPGGGGSAGGYESDEGGEHGESD